MPRQHAASTSVQFYEPQFFKYSVTYNSWVKLFIADSHALTTIDGFEGTRARFWNNHPIRWIKLVGIVVAVVVKVTFAEITIDDGSGFCMNLYLKGTAAESLGIDFEENRCLADVGHLVKVKGTLANDHKGDLQLVVKEIQIIKDLAFEMLAWRERVEYRENVLDVPWVLDPTVVPSTAHKSRTPGDASFNPLARIQRKQRIPLNKDEANELAQLREIDICGRKIDLAAMDSRHHTQRNLKLVLLQHFAEYNTREFSVSDLRTNKQLEQATVCVARESWRKQASTAGISTEEEAQYRVDSKQKYRTLNACLTELVRDGSILSTNVNEGRFCVVGPWNLGTIMRDIVRDIRKHGRVAGKEIDIREIWQQVRASGRGYERVSKQMVKNMAEQLGEQLLL